MKELFGDRVEFHTLKRDNLEIDAFEKPTDYMDHFRGKYGPTIVAENNARANGREAEFVDAVRSFTDEWNVGPADDARFEMEYLVIVGTVTRA